MYKVDLICAARPNFMKIAPLYHALKKSDFAVPRLIHTGQHYDALMSDVFFSDFLMPAPDIHLNIGSGTHAQQTAGVMVAYERLASETPPDVVIVVGDVNSSLAVTLAAKKLNLPVAHLEAGLRSYDREMPEELNRLAIDVLADLLWTPSIDADENLAREGIPAERVNFVGNIMIDSYHLVKEKIAAAGTREKFNLDPKSYMVVTLHRPSNVDRAEKLQVIFDSLQNIKHKIIFPVHPRTRKNIAQFDIRFNDEKIKLCDPMGYIDFMNLVSDSVGVVTDSGGIQEETTYLDIPCYTLRDNTERPLTITMGSNQLATAETLGQILNAPVKKGQIPPLWDGKTAGRVADSLKKFLEKSL